MKNAIEQSVVRITKIAHPQDLGKPTGRLEDAIREEMRKLVSVAENQAQQNYIQDVVAELKEQKFYQYLQVAGFHKEAEDYLTQLVKEVEAGERERWPKKSVK